MEMSRVSSGSALAATAAIGTVAAAAGLWWMRSVKNQGDDGELEELSDVTRDQVTKFFDIINMEQSAMVASFSQQVAQFRGKIPEQQLLELATTNFEEHLAKSQAQLLDRMGISEEDMEDASLHYAAAGDTQVQDGMKQLKNMYLAVAGLPSGEKVDIPDDLTAEKMVDVVKVYFSASIGAARDVVEELLSQGKSFQDPGTVMEMNLLYQKQSQSAVDEALEQFSLDSNTIQHAIEKFSENLGVQNALRTGTMEQQQLLASYGLR